MKKKLLLFVIISALILVMTVSVGASDYVPAFGDVTELDGIAAPSILDTESRVYMTDGKTYPAYYILNDSKDFSPNFNKINNIVGSETYSRATVLALEIPEGITNLPSCYNAGAFFQGDKFEEAIEYVRLPSTLETMGEAAIFQITTLKVIDNFENTKVVEIPRRQEGLSSLQYIHLPNTVKTISHRAFFGCKSLEYIIMGSSVEYIGGQAFYQAGVNSGKSSLKVYISSSVTEIEEVYDGVIQGCNSVVELYYTGNMEDAGMQQILGTPGILKNASKWPTVDASAENFDKNATYEKSTIIYNYNACDAFYGGVHDISDPEYQFTSFTENTYKAAVCSQCKLTQISEEYGKILVISGFSNSANGIMYNYAINRAALDAYIKAGRNVTFGVVVAIGNVTSPLNADGTLAEGTSGYASNLTDRGNDLYEIAIKGIPAEHLATSLVCCGYICDGENVYYMGATSLEETSTPVTLEALIALTPAETKEEY